MQTASQRQKPPDSARASTEGDAARIDEDVSDDALLVLHVGERNALEAAANLALQATKVSDVSKTGSRPTRLRQ
jgi:hypothetical protein